MARRRTRAMLAAVALLAAALWPRSGDPIRTAGPASDTAPAGVQDVAAPVPASATGCEEPLPRAGARPGEANEGRHDDGGSGRPAAVEIRDLRTGARAPTRVATRPIDGPPPPRLDLRLRDARPMPGGRRR